jgi:glycosyltransferase involved in cell wall biosynthesis
MSSAIDYTVVIPVYKNCESLPELLASLEATLSKLNTKNEIIFVVDGSPDNSFNQIQDLLPLKNAEVLIVNLSRNFGSIPAVRTGLMRARGKFAAVIAADLQEPTTILLDFYGALQQKDVDVVVGVRESRNDPFFTKVFSKIYWGFYRKIINKEIPIGGVDVFACTEKAYKQITRLPESGSSLIGLIYWIGFKKDQIKYTRVKRPYGKSAWTFKNKFRYMSDSIYAFSNAPILLLQLIGSFGIFSSILLGVVTFVGTITGQITEPGYPSLISALLLSSSSLLLGLGIVGNYAWRSFENSKLRPISVTQNEKYFERNGKSE